MEPGGQGLHSSDPGDAEYFPGPQGLQSSEEEELMRLECLPAAHNVHEAWPILSAYDPALHPLQVLLEMVSW